MQLSREVMRDSTCQGPEKSSQVNFVFHTGTYSPVALGAQAYENLIFWLPDLQSIAQKEKASPHPYCYTETIFIYQFRKFV